MTVCVHVRCHAIGPFGSRFVKCRQEWVPYLLCDNCRAKNHERYERNGASYRQQQKTPEARVHIVKNRENPERKSRQSAYNKQYRESPEGKDVVVSLERARGAKIRANAGLRMEATLSASIRGRLQGVRHGDSANIANYTDFESIDDLVEHFRDQLKPGMAIENYGKQYWTIAHIIPKCYYDFSDPEEIRRCNSKANLGCDYEVWPNPLNERTNGSKGGAMPTLEEIAAV